MNATAALVSSQFKKLVGAISSVFILIVFGPPVLGLDTITTNQIGQGVVYRHYHFDNLYNSKQEVYVTDVDLNDPAISMRFRYLTGGAVSKTSAFASSTPSAVAAINGTFFDATGSRDFLKVDGTIINLTQPQVHDQQAITDDGFRAANSINIAVRPDQGWSSLSASNVIACGPDLVQEGIKVTNYDPSDPFITGRNPRTCAGWTYDNHLLLMVVDGRTVNAAGMTIPELRDELYAMGAIRNGFNFDGGGSSTMWAGGGVVNVPSDGIERSVANAVVIIAPPVPPTGLIANAGNAQVALSWTASSGATGYKVKRAAVSGGPYTVVASPTATSYTDTTVVNGTTYYYVVSATNPAESANSSQVSATPQAGLVPNAPTALSVSVPSQRRRLNLSWTQSSSPGITQNKVYRSTSGAFGPYSLHVTLAAATSYSDTGLTSGQQYFYEVTAVNGNGESGFSNYSGGTAK